MLSHVFLLTSHWLGRIWRASGDPISRSPVSGISKRGRPGGSGRAPPANSTFEMRNPGDVCFELTAGMDVFIRYHQVVVRSRSVKRVIFGLLGFLSALRVTRLYRASPVANAFASFGLLRQVPWLDVMRCGGLMRTLVMHHRCCCACVLA